MKKSVNSLLGSLVTILIAGSATADTTTTGMLCQNAQRIGEVLMDLRQSGTPLNRTVLMLDVTGNKIFDQALVDLTIDAYDTPISSGDSDTIIREFGNYAEKRCLSNNGWTE